MKNPRCFFPGDTRRLSLVSGLLALVFALAACSGATPGPSATPPTTVPVNTPPPTPVAGSAQPEEPTPVPTATIPVATPTAALPEPLPFERLPVPRLTETALGYVTHLSVELGPRESGTAQELAAAEYISSELESFGYSVESQPFTTERLSLDLSGVVLDAPETRELAAAPLRSSGIGLVSGPLQATGLAREGDIPEGGLQGKIALVERGIITFEQKVARSVNAGATAVIIYNNLPGNFRGVLLTPGSVPVVAISRQDGLRIEQLLSQGPVTATVNVVQETLHSQNIVAEKPGSHDDFVDAVVVLGGHYDTVAGVPGANDNASGTAVLLTIAKELSQGDLPFTVRFVAFGSEELGLLGSSHHISSLGEDNRAKIRAMLNFDALGTGLEVKVLGNRTLTGLTVELGDAQQIPVSIDPGLQGGGSDHQSFSNAGIPVLMFFADDFSRIHTDLDTLDAVSPSLLGQSAGLAVALLRSPGFLDTLN